MVLPKKQLLYHISHQCHHFHMTKSILTLRGAVLIFRRENVLIMTIF